MSEKTTGYLVHAAEMAHAAERYLTRPDGADTARARTAAEISRAWSALAEASVRAATWGGER